MPIRNHSRWPLRLYSWLLAWALLPSLLYAQTPEKAPPLKDPEFCLECHDDLLEEKVIHKAIQDSCLDCHSNLDAAKRPHKNSGSFRYGLDAAEPALCFGCHGKLLGKKKNSHKAIEKGCTVCHDPHSSKHKRLLKSALPNLCGDCHKKDNFVGTVQHKPVAEGKCGSCHENHASDNPALLLKSPVENCLECHAAIKDQPHVVSGFSRKGHPIGNEAQAANDPLRAGKPFYCGSCHEPHRSEFKRLLRIDPKSGMMACQKCHEK